eukprot:COSAG02_NODE_23379_length_720_cov_1.508857_1_plen_210_part_10
MAAQTPSSQAYEHHMADYRRHSPLALPTTIDAALAMMIKRWRKYGTSSRPAAAGPARVLVLASLILSLIQTTHAIVCTRPASITGYTVTDNNLDLSAGAFDVSVGCADGYEGTAAVSACTTDGAYTLSGCSCDSEEGATWTLVRYTDGNVHPAQDNLCGTEEYGTHGSTASWSVVFDTAVPGWDQFMFASGDCNRWIVMPKEQAIGHDGA